MKFSCNLSNDNFCQELDTLPTKTHERSQMTASILTLRHHDVKPTKSFLISPIRVFHGYQQYKCFLTSHSHKEATSNKFSDLLTITEVT